VVKNLKQGAALRSRADKTVTHSGRWALNFFSGFTADPGRAANAAAEAAVFKGNCADEIVLISSFI